MAKKMTKRKPRVRRGASKRGAKQRPSLKEILSRMKARRKAAELFRQELAEKLAQAGLDVADLHDG